MIFIWSKIWFDFFFYNEFKIYMLSYLDSSVMIPGDFKSLRQTYLES